MQGRKMTSMASGCMAKPKQESLCRDKREREKREGARVKENE